MGTTELVELIKKLPADKKKAVEELVAELIADNNSKNIKTAHVKERMKFGDLKGFVTYIADDFDEPLDDFKDYM